MPMVQPSPYIIPTTLGPSPLPVPSPVYTSTPVPFTSISTPVFTSSSKFVSAPDQPSVTYATAHTPSFTSAFVTTATTLSTYSSSSPLPQPQPTYTATPTIPIPIITESAPGGEPRMVCRPPFGRQLPQEKPSLLTVTVPDRSPPGREHGKYDKC